MQDFEKLGAFYLGKSVETDSGDVGKDLVLYDSKDLTTHAVIIGMTGSGKTGLGIGLIEEAAIDKIPVIAIDPKGDMGNLLLTFPKLSGANFAPWVDPQTASAAGQTQEEFGASQAELWKKGLKKWGQNGARIKRLRDTAEFALYTPGSSAGRSVSVLENFSAPSEAVLNDADVYNDRVQATATSILSLVGVDSDPITSKEHILLSNILNHYWQAGKDVDIGTLIGAIQQPPMQKVGVMELDAFFSPKDRFGLAMRLNNLLAAPGFAAWMQGEPLSAESLFYTPGGKPKVSVMSIAHLSEDQRMFFVAMLLSEILTWMRSQPGTGSLRAILYMDEIFGYMPPTANPPTKRLLLTLLKQARAYGLGLVLSTQNPVDLDYKGLSNTGTWFIGRLQTERDKKRVMEGLEGAAAGGKFNRGAMEQTLAGLGKRKFLLHNVHEDKDIVFGTRWVMSYLAGPMTREQLKRLHAQNSTNSTSDTTLKPFAKKAAVVTPKIKKDAIDASQMGGAQPALDPKINQYYVPMATAPKGSVVYQPMYLGAADVLYSSARYNIESEKTFIRLGEFDDSLVPVDWQESEGLTLAVDELQTKAETDDCAFLPVGTQASKVKNYAKWEKLFKRWVRIDNAITLYRYKPLKAMSEVGEAEGQFRVRLQNIAREQRDLAVAKLRSKYAPKVAAAEERLRKAVQKLEVEQQQAKKKKLDTAMSFGAAILGSLLGRKKVSYTSASRVRTAVGRLGSSRKEAGDVERAEETIDVLQQAMSDLSAKVEEEVAALEEGYDAQQVELDEIVIKPKSTEILIHLVGLAWVPCETDGSGGWKRLD